MTDEVFEDDMEDSPFPRDRDRDVLDRPLGPMTLIGSFFRAEAHGEHDDPLEGLVVGEPYASAVRAVYLVEKWDEHGATGVQWLVELDQMQAEKWQFFDSEGWLSVANATNAETKEKLT